MKLKPQTCFFKLILLLLLISPLASDGQIDDNIMWAKWSAQSKIKPNTTFILAPILRMNTDISTYQDVSLDYTLRQKINKHFSVSMIGRTWFLRNGNLRQFIWPQISFAQSYDKWKLSSYLRLHYAMDISDRPDADFLRWKGSVNYTVNNKWQMFVGVEPFYRLNSENEVERMRYSLGTKYKLSKNWSLSFEWWSENTHNVDIPTSVNIFVPHIAYIFD